MQTQTFVSDQNPKFTVHYKDVPMDEILDLTGAKYEPVLGKYEGKEERSYHVKGLTQLQAETLAYLYGQESVCFFDGKGWKLIYVNGKNMAKYLNQVGAMALSQRAPEDNYTMLSNGVYVQIDFDWGNFQNCED
jgi:hypothetical protein